MKSLNERKKQMLEDCASCGPMAAGGDGFEASADAAGPTAGYDPLMKTISRIKKSRKKKRGE